MSKRKIIIYTTCDVVTIPKHTGKPILYRLNDEDVPLVGKEQIIVDPTLGYGLSEDGLIKVIKVQA